MTATRKIPQRKCIGCNEMKDKKDLIRVIRTPESEILLDPTGKKNGRGAYVCKESACLKKAIKSKAIERSFQCSIPEEIYDTLIKELQNIESR